MVATLKEIEKNRIVKANCNRESNTLSFNRPKDAGIKKRDSIRVLASVNDPNTRQLRFTYDTATVEAEKEGLIQIRLNKKLDDRLIYEVEIPSTIKQSDGKRYYFLINYRKKRKKSK